MSGARNEITRLRVAFAVYAALLVWVILWKLELPTLEGHGLRHLKLVPFVATASEDRSTGIEVLANFALFVPFGAMLGLLAPNWGVWRSCALIAAASAGLEALQFVLDIGVTDVTDVLVNTAGGLAGFWLCATLGKRRRLLLARICGAGVWVAAIAAVLWFLSPLQFTQQDVWVDRPPGSMLGEDPRP